jgi:hypothetical protein
LLVVAVERDHLVASTDDPEVGELPQAPHQVVSGSWPVATSAPQFGHLAVAMAPTMKPKAHSGQIVRVDGGSGGLGGGGSEAAVGADRGSGAPAPRTMFTEPHTGHENRPAPGTSN